MRSPRRRSLRCLATLSLCASLAACGRKGALEGPPGSGLPRAHSVKAQASSETETPETVGKSVTGAVVPPKAHFPLDPLL